MAQSRYVPLNDVAESVSTTRRTRWRNPYDDGPPLESASPHQELDGNAFQPELPLLSDAAAPGVAQRHSYVRQDSQSVISRPEPTSTPTIGLSAYSSNFTLGDYRHGQSSSPDLSDGPIHERPRPFSLWSGESLQSMLELKERVRYSMTPSMHDMVDKYKIGTARRFDYFRQAKRLWRLVIGEALLSWIFCSVYVGILKAYERKGDLDENGQRLFNTLTTGISLFIGINLTASLRSYAKLLRWRLVAYCYRPLRNFDLVLGCDSLMNVLNLVFVARNSRHRFLPSWTQTFGFFWLATNLSLTLSVGMVSLNFGLNAAAFTALTAPGLAWMVNLDSVQTGQYYLDLTNLNEYGYLGYANNDRYNTDGLGYAYARTDSWTSLQNGTTQFFLQLRDLGWTMTSLSHMHIRSDVHCDQYNVVDGITGSHSWFVYENNGRHNVSYPADPVGQGGLLVMANQNSSCGETCTNVNAFQAGNLEDPYSPGAQVFKTASYFECTSTLTYILDKNEEVADGLLWLSDKTNGTFQPAPETLRMLAGSIGWSDVQPNGTTWQYHVYGSGSDVGWIPEQIPAPNQTMMQDCISQFVMGGITAMSSTGSNGIYYHQVLVDEAPVAAQYLSVSNWLYTYLLLFGIPVGHTITMVLVIWLANNALIKDFSPLAISKLYWTLLKDKGLGTKGCMLSGDELVEQMGNPHVGYGWIETDVRDHQGRPIGHVDIFEHGRSYPKEVELSFRRHIFYDGDGADVVTEGFNAKDWF